MDVGEEDTLSFLVVVVVVVVVVEVSMLPLRRNGLVQPHKMHTAATFAICIGVSISLQFVLMGIFTTSYKKFYYWKTLFYYRWYRYRCIIRVHAILYYYRYQYQLPVPGRYQYRFSSGSATGSTISTRYLVYPARYLYRTLRTFKLVNNSVQTVSSHPPPQRNIITRA